jgi:multidrug efflux system outer membrane protein
VIALTLAGCTVGPNYERPKLEPPAQHRSIPQAPAPTPESVADLSWWQLFQDPALQALIREGVANNFDLRIASARVVEARALAGIAKSFLSGDRRGFGTRRNSSRVSGIRS